MVRKNPSSSLGLVSTERDGSSHLWAVKGTDVSTVRVAESSAADEKERRREEEYEKAAAASGLRRLDREDAEDARERAI